jgi:MFS family permease
LLHALAQRDSIRSTREDARFRDDDSQRGPGRAVRLPRFGRDAPEQQQLPDSEGGPEGARFDRGFSVLSIAGFSLSLGAAGLVLPLLAINAGYDIAAVGVFTAISAVSQLGFRLWLPYLLTKFSDRDLIIAANVMMVASFLVLLVSTSMPAFILAQLLQGAARALFWTASQTHAVRGKGGLVASLSIVQATGNVGQLVGPPIAGVVAAQSLEAGLVLCAIAAAIGLVCGFGMTLLPTFARQKRQEGQQRIWRRPGVDVACWASYSAGGWRAMAMSLIPAALEAAGQPRQVIGVLMMISEATGLATSAVLVRFRVPNVGAAIQAAVVMLTAALVSFPFVASNAVTAALAMALGGLGSGLLMSLGPALATMSVSPEERGEAIAVAGTFRAVALLVTPGAAAFAIGFVTLPVGMVVAGLVIGVPPMLAALRRTMTPSPTPTG